MTGTIKLEIPGHVSQQSPRASVESWAVIRGETGRGQCLLNCIERTHTTWQAGVFTSPLEGIVTCEAPSARRSWLCRLGYGLARGRSWLYDSMREQPDRQRNENDATGRVKAPRQNEPMADIVPEVRTGSFRKQASKLKCKVFPERLRECLGFHDLLELKLVLGSILSQ